MEDATIITDDEVMDVSNYSTSPRRRNGKSANIYDKTLCKDNKTLTRFINKCICLDPTYEMENIVNKVLLPAYVCADEEYKKSDQFQRVLTKAFKRLTNEPEKKYSHISDVLDTLKLHTKRPKKRKVDFVTLSSTVNPEMWNKSKLGKTQKVRPKRPKVDVIALDDEDDDVIAIVDSDKTNEEQKARVDNSNNKNTIKIQDSQELKIVEETQDNEDVKIVEEIQDSQNVQIVEIQNRVKNNVINNAIAVIQEHEQDKENVDNNDNDSGNKLLVPLREIVQVEKKTEELSEAEINKRIEEIEAEIAKAKNKIEALELAEVTEDSGVSPYIQCHRLEAHIVKLYKELCALVDEEPVKTRKVRLQVGEGQPEGPVRRLERLLNKQVDEEGVAPFPDFNDVVRCVEKANVKDGLGWSKAKILREAQEMFIYCGRALQRRRQGREWRDLRARAAAGFDDDPAARDAELRARLEVNRRLAVAKETEVLERFSRMESNNNGALTEMDVNVNVKEEPEEFPINIQFKADISLVIEISDSESSGDEL